MEIEVKRLAWLGPNHFPISLLHGLPKNSAIVVITTNNTSVANINGISVGSDHNCRPRPRSKSISLTVSTTWQLLPSNIVPPPVRALIFKMVQTRAHAGNVLQKACDYSACRCQWKSKCWWCLESLMTYGLDRGPLLNRRLQMPQSTLRPRNEYFDELTYGPTL